MSDRPFVGAPVHGMEMMRYGVFGDAVFPHFD
jgi:hypothetical protein